MSAGITAERPSDAVRSDAARSAPFGLGEDDLAQLDSTPEPDFNEASARPQATDESEVRPSQWRNAGSRAVARRLPDAGALARRRPAPADARHDSMRALRTELLLRHHSRSSANIIAVVSPSSGEGRSQLAADLAGSFAQLGQPTLLVDADLRRPSQHLLYGLDNDEGLANAIASGHAARMHPVGPGDLMLLTAGTSELNPAELLSSGAFEQLLGGWSERFDHIIFDSPPAAEYPDALSLATLVGRILTLSRAQHTSLKATREMLRRLEATRAELLGAVIGHF